MKSLWLAACEAIFDEELAKHNDLNRLTLIDIEIIALSVGAKMSEQTGQLFVEDKFQSDLLELGCCKCGSEMRYKGRKNRYVHIQCGTLHLSRAYYYCRHCRSGFFPLDEQLGLNDDSLSNGLKQNIIWLRKHLSCALVSEVLDRIGHNTIPPSTVWDVCQRAES